MNPKSLAQLIWLYSLALKQEYKSFARVPVARRYRISFVQSQFTSIMLAYPVAQGGRINTNFLGYLVDASARSVNDLSYS